MRILLAILCLVPSLTGASAPKPSRPPCSRQTAGRFWPEEANSDTSLARALSRRGKLEICTRTTWSYRWLSPTVDVKQLRKSRRQSQIQVN